MKLAWQHAWNLTPRQAIELQTQARRRARPRDAAAVVRWAWPGDPPAPAALPGPRPGSRYPDPAAIPPAGLPPRLLAADVGYDRVTDTCFAALMEWDTCAGVALGRWVNIRRSSFPYVPGLLSFRELPPLIPLFESRSRRPALVVCDAQGYAHPRRLGAAAHLGAVLGSPTLGWAKSRLIGEHDEPGIEAGAATPLWHEGEQIGWALRSRAATSPTYVSPGWGLSMITALAVARALLGRHRQCEPARAAHAATVASMLEFRADRVL